MRCTSARNCVCRAEPMGGESSEGPGAIWGPEPPAGSRPVRLRVSDARDGSGIRGRDRVVQSIALRLASPDVRCAEKEVPLWAWRAWPSGRPGR